MLFGRDHYAIAWRLASVAWLGCALLQFILYLRPSPYGGPFLLHWKTFIIRPLVYELLAVWLIALPFLFLWLFLYRRPLASPRWRFVHWLMIALMTLNIAISQLDHEIYRFLGIRLGPSFLAVYGQAETMADDLFLNVLKGDRGGPFIGPALCILAPVLYLWWSVRTVRRRMHLLPELRFGAKLAIALLVLPFSTGMTGWMLAKARFRLTRLEPAAFAMIRDLNQSFEDDHRPELLDATIRAWQEEWQAGSTDRGWRFPDPERPFLRVPVAPRRPLPEERWNVVIIQLESVRGVDTGHLRPDRSPTPTPYLDSLARSPHAAVYTRALSFGPPSVNGRFATQCSLTPSSRRWVTAHTHIATWCLPDALRRHGYRAEAFSAGDIDMDNSTVWVERMYHRLWRYPEVGQVDREVFRRAAARLRELGRQGPFIATLLTASNHHPFHSPEPRLDVAGHGSVHERILNSTRYTDDVVRELIEGMRSEPWFGRTLWVINSDHGYNLGEHDGIVGGYTLYRESTWSPFLIYGAHPRLPAGRHDMLVTLLDVAPTIADLIGLREANPWQGHSLLAVRPDRTIRMGFRESLLVETPGWTALRDPHDGQPRLYAPGDWLQRRNLAGTQSARAREMLDRAERERRMHDYLLRQGRIWRSGAR